MKRRQFLRTAAGTVFAGFAGVAASETGVSASAAPVTKTSIESLESSADQLNRLRVQHGGSNVLEFAEKLLDQGAGFMQRQAPSEEWQQRLNVAHADISAVAGWANYETGNLGKAHYHLQTALQQATTAQAFGLTNLILHRSGRIELELGRPESALGYYELEEVAAKRTGNSHLIAASLTSQARAHARLGDVEQAQRFLHRSSSERLRNKAGTLDRYPCEQRMKVYLDNQTFFDAEWGATLIGSKNLTPELAEQSINLLEQVVENRSEEDALWLCVELAQLSQGYKAIGEQELADQTGSQAVDMSTRFQSKFADGYINNLTKTASPELTNYISKIHHN